MWRGASLAAVIRKSRSKRAASEVFIGEGVDYAVEIRNVKNPSAPDLSALRQDFDIVPNGDESHNQSSMFILNGKVTQQNTFGHTYRFRLTPKRTGKLAIPGPSTTVDGKTISGRGLTLNVIAPETKTWSSWRSKRIARKFIPRSRSR